MLYAWHSYIFLIWFTVYTLYNEYILHIYKISFYMTYIRHIICDTTYFTTHIWDIFYAIFIQYHTISYASHKYDNTPYMLYICYISYISYEYNIFHWYMPYDMYDMVYTIYKLYNICNMIYTHDMNIYYMLYIATIWTWYIR